MHNTRTLLQSVNGQYSNPIKMHSIIIEMFFLAPSVPVQVTAYNISSTSIMVTWQPPISPNGIVRSYRIELTTGGVADNTYTVNTSIIINMLEKFTTYQIQVFATTVAEGDGSVIVIVTTNEDSTLQFGSNSCKFRL